MASHPQPQYGLNASWLAHSVALTKEKSRRRRFVVTVSLLAGVVGIGMVSISYYPSFLDKYGGLNILSVPRTPKELTHEEKKLMDVYSDNNNEAMKYDRNLMSRKYIQPPPRKLLVARGAGPEFTGSADQVYKLGEVSGQGVSWFKMLSSPRLQWNVAPYRWKNCPRGEDAFVGHTGFTFHEPDPLDPTKVKSKYLRFRLERRDERECQWNFSKSCLAGGSLIMNLGQTAKDVLYPGDYPLKTSNGVIRIVAFNTNRACIRRIDSMPIFTEIAHRDVTEKAPIDYLRQALSSTSDPERCEAWAKEHELDEKLFSYNSDLSTVHVDTPWMQIIIQVEQNKVATDSTCAFASMNIWITDVSPGILEDGFSGLLAENHMTVQASRSLRRVMDKSQEVDGSVHQVDGPFGVHG